MEEMEGVIIRTIANPRLKTNDLPNTHRSI